MIDWRVGGKEKGQPHFSSAGILRDVPRFLTPTVAPAKNVFHAAFEKQLSEISTLNLSLNLRLPFTLLHPLYYPNI